MSDDKLIRLSDAIAALNSVALTYGATWEPHSVRLCKDALRAIPAVQVGVKPDCGHPWCGDKCGTEVSTAQPSPDVAALTDAEIAEIERGGKRWHGEAPQSYRWEPYKPDGQRQMKAKGRWQRQVGSGDYWRWENCERPAALARLKGGAA